LNDVQTLLQAVVAIYGAPGSQGNWSRALQAVADSVGSNAGVYFLANHKTGDVELFSHYGYTAEHERRYRTEGTTSDIRFSYMDQLIPGRVYRDFELVPDRAAYDASPWIRYQLESLGLYWSMFAKVSTHGLWTDIISLNTAFDHGQHSDEEKARLTALLPHLSRAAELHRTVTRLQQQYSAVLAVLDKLLVGLIVLDEFGRVVVANAAARRTCEVSGALCFTKEGTLRARSPQSDARLQQLLQATSAAANARGHSDGGSLMLDKLDRQGRVLLDVLPLRDDGFVDGDDLRGTAVMVIDPDRAEALSADGLAQIFGLTPAEQSVTESLVNGHDPRRIAEERGNSIETVRGQLRAVFAKTGVQSQLDLLRLAIRANPPIAKT
jgi:DNA-binding CsgD family transcriptional regulator